MTDRVREALAEFSAYVVRNYPPGTIIGDPAWHAPRLLRAARAALSALPQEPTADPAASKDHDWAKSESAPQNGQELLRAIMVHNGVSRGDSVSASGACAMSDRAMIYTTAATAAQQEK